MEEFIPNPEDYIGDPDDKDFNGFYTEYAPGPCPYRIRDLDHYCKARGIEPVELSPEELDMFRVKNVKDVHTA